MKKLILILGLVVAPALSIWAAGGGSRYIDTPKNTPILTPQMERLFEDGCLGEVVDKPEKTSIDTLIDRLIFEKANPNPPSDLDSILQRTELPRSEQSNH